MDGAPGDWWLSGWRTSNGKCDSRSLRDDNKKSNHKGKRTGKSRYSAWGPDRKSTRWMGHLGDYTLAMPPSTNSSMPRINLPSFEARNEAALATSSERPISLAGIMERSCFFICSTTSSGRFVELQIGVSIGPGLITLTRIFRSLSSNVQVRAKERMAAFVALYVPKPGKAACDAF